MHVEDESVGENTVVEVFQKGFSLGRQGAALRHGEGSQLKGATLMNGKKLYRNTENKMLAGVCSGIADYFDIDPTLVRLGWVLFSLLGGSGLLAYIIAAIIIPDAHLNNKSVK